jgi:hypothetical protein
MPLTRLKDEYLEEDGVRFSMADENGTSVACRVSHEALRDHADRLHLSGTDGAVFDVYRELIEEVASAAYDAESPLDDHGTFAPFRTQPRPPAPDGTVHRQCRPSGDLGVSADPQDHGGGPFCRQDISLKAKR